MIEYKALFKALEATPLRRLEVELSELITERLDPRRHGDLMRWAEAIETLPKGSGDDVELNRSAIGIGEHLSKDTPLRNKIETALRQLHPWRKGPFELCGIKIDTEWRSDWKWERLQDQIQPLEKRLVLDVGCGNGYHCWRMLGEGAARVIGIDPTLLSIMQFQATKKMAGADFPIDLLPIGIEAIPAGLEAFDTVFSMGVLYHRRSPIDHLLELANCLKPGGELVLETLVIEGTARTSLVPADRYAKMRNVWFIPSCDTLTGWLERCGYHSIKLIDVTKTTTEEQRSTDWMQFHSLADFLDPENSALTCEGYPAPQRAIFTATKP